MSKLAKVEKDELREIIEKHQKKHPGCKLNERRCRYEIADDCIGKADKSHFKKSVWMCKRCTSMYNRNYYEQNIQGQKKKKTTKK